MRLPLRILPRSLDADHRAFATAGDGPTSGEILAEIGVLLTIHLAVAFAATVTLRLFGIA